MKNTQKSTQHTVKLSITCYYLSSSCITQIESHSLLKPPLHTPAFIYLLSLTHFILTIHNIQSSSYDVPSCSLIVGITQSGT